MKKNRNMNNKERLLGFFFFPFYFIIRINFETEVNKKSDRTGLVGREGKRRASE